MPSSPEYQAAWRARNWQRIAAYAAQYRQQNADLLRAKCARRYAANPTKFKREQRKYRQQQLERQRLKRGLPLPPYPCPDTCECCGKPQTKKAMALDHDHVTGEFRGWLCEDCNLGIGRLGDTLEGVLRAVGYLIRKAIKCF